MSDYNSGRPTRREYGYDDRPRGAARPQGARPQGARPQGARPQGRPDPARRPQSTRPQGARPQGRPDPARRPQSARPQNGYNRRPVRGRKRKSAKPIIFAVIAVLLIAALIIGISSCAGPDKTVQPKATEAPQTQGGNLTNATLSQGSAPIVSGFEGTTPMPNNGREEKQYSTLADRLADSDAELEALSADEQIQVEDLSITPNLPSEWMNVLLLGADQRLLTESSRTDAILICSINTNTGEVKLSSILRDTQVELQGLPAEYGKNFRINAINYFGGPKYVMKFINEKLRMNIQYYVMVNFYGFAKIASALGGIEMDISEAEMEEINWGAVDQAWDAYYAGVDESDLEAAGENVLLETFGKNTHLNGRQTLAYARIRHLDSDTSRTDRQRRVLIALLNKVKGIGVGAIALIPSLFGNVTTNMDMDAIAKVASTVLMSNISDVPTLRMPINNSYVQATRNNQSMLWDTDWNTNANELYNFIYT